MARRRVRRCCRDLNQIWFRTRLCIQFDWMTPGSWCYRKWSPASAKWSQSLVGCRLPEKSRGNSWLIITSCCFEHGCAGGCTVYICVFKCTVSRHTQRFKCVAPISMSCFGRCFFFSVLSSFTRQHQIAMAAAPRGQFLGVMSLLEMLRYFNLNITFSQSGTCLKTEGRSLVGHIYLMWMYMNNSSQNRL